MTEEQRARLERVVWIDPDRMSGAPCFFGTRVPVQMLLDHLKHGDTIDEFLDGAPSVSREQAELFLELACQQLKAVASSSALPPARNGGNRARELRWLKDHAGEYANLWVAVEGDQLIANGREAKTVFAAARARGITRPFVVRVDPADAPPFGGW